MKLVFALPGSNFTRSCTESLLYAVIHLTAKGHTVWLSMSESPNLYYVRSQCLDGDMSYGKKQKPFRGNIPYDKIIWIDSDISFSIEQIIRLMQSPFDIVSGLYLMQDGKAFATVENEDKEHVLSHGGFRFLTPEDIQKRQEPFPVYYTGMGFMAVKRGVYESLDYPWFYPRWITIGDMRDFTFEDVTFCMNATEKGFPVMIDPTIVVGHRKSVTLLPPKEMIPLPKVVGIN